MVHLNFQPVEEYNADSNKKKHYVIYEGTFSKDSEEFPFSLTDFYHTGIMPVIAWIEEAPVEPLVAQTDISKAYKTLTKHAKIPPASGSPNSLSP